MLLYFLFFAYPIIAIVAFVRRLDNYRYAKKTNKLHPGAISAAELAKRKTSLIISAVIAGIIVAIVIGIMILLSSAVAYM